MKRKISYEEIEKDLADFKKVLKMMRESRKQIIKTIEGNETKIEKALGNFIENVEFQVTELQKKEEELEKAREFASTLFSNLPLPATLSTPEGIRIDANLAFCRFFKKTREECVRAPMKEMYVKEDIPKLEEALEACKRTGSGSCEARMIRRDGAIRNHAIRFSVLKDKSGKIMNILESGADLTELRKHEAELKESNKFNQMIVENVPSLIWMADKEGKCSLINKEFTRILGYKPVDLIGKVTPKAPYVCKDGLPYMKEGTVEALKKQWRYSIEKKEIAPPMPVPLLTKDGEKRIFLGIEVPWGKTGEGRLWSGIDMTELRRREREQANAISALSKVLGMTAKGNLSARVDTRGWSEELATIGMAINTLIEALEFEKKSKV
jgi:PAS domain S-box-containing protein